MTLTWLLMSLLKRYVLDFKCALLGQVMGSEEDA